MSLGRATLSLLALIAATFARADDNSASAAEVRVPLQFEGGHKTDPVDRGRPVVLVAVALGVPPAVFREAFTHVHPAGVGHQPQPDDVRQNKRELMSRLAKYGVTDERLNEVSNYYRYPPGSHGLWRHVEAAGFAIVRGNKVVRIEITEPGAGYTTPPLVSVQGVGLTEYLIARLDFNTNLGRNGSIASVTISPLRDNNRQADTMVPDDGVIETGTSGNGPPPPQPQPPPPPPPPR